MPDWLRDLSEIGVALCLVALNGFFVAAEFSLVKVRGSQIEELVRQGRPFSKTARWLAERLEGSLSACQLGITIASLALGWVGEPAFAHLLRPMFAWMGMLSEHLIHIVAFTIAFTTITALHLVIGEQAPKIFAIRRPEQMVLWCAVPLKFFYIVTYPLLIALNNSTSFILKRLGVDGASEHDTPHTEDEIRALLREAHIHGGVTGSEHRLINAVFEFDDMICRRVMVPRADVDIFMVDDSLADCLERARTTKHTRFPLCEGSLDNVIGVVHTKDLMGLSKDESVNLREYARPPKTVPENMPISRLLRHFQASRQHLALVVDEYGTVIGIVTLENVIEQIVGPVEDEFDLETPEIIPEGPNQYIVAGSTAVNVVAKRLKLDFDNYDADTFSGLLTAQAGAILTVGNTVRLDGATAEVLEVKNARALRIRVILDHETASEATPAE